MARSSKLLAALDAHKGRDHDHERQVKLQKDAAKRKRNRAVKETSNEEMAESKILGSGKGEIHPGSRALGVNGDLYLTKNNHAVGGEHDGTEAEAVPLSDIDSQLSSDREDTLPFQRITINNVVALASAHKAFALPTDLPFSAYQSLVTSSPVEIPDINDDLNRELVLYRQCLDGAERGRGLLKLEGAPFTRPSDFFAETVKSDEHMEKIRQQMADEAAKKQATREAKKQRELKKFGKQTQIVREQERAMAKRATLDKISLMKRKRKNADLGHENEAEQFDVALEAFSDDEKVKRASDTRKGLSKGTKRQKKNERFGFGGKKRGSKRGDTLSSGDVSHYKAPRPFTNKGSTKRLGKSRRESRR